MSYIKLKVKDWVFDKAKSIRKERDKIYGNYFAERKTDQRWIGEVGEIVFNGWVQCFGNPDSFTWQDNPDFLINGISVDTKTAKRKGPYKEGYTSLVTAALVEKHPVDYYFFMSYQLSTQEMWMLGAVPYETFKKESVFYGPGEQVHRFYTVPDDDSIYNIDSQYFLDPMEWLNTIAT